jgi:hypothetical protein
MTTTGTRRDEGSTGRQGLALPSVNHFKSGLLDIPHYRSIYVYYELRTNVCRWSRYCDKDGVYRGWRTYPAIYRDFMKGIQQSQGGDSPAASVNCNQFGTRLQFARWVDLQLLGVGWRDINAIVWIKITCS